MPAQMCSDASNWRDAHRLVAASSGRVGASVCALGRVTIVPTTCAGSGEQADAVAPEIRKATIGN